MSLAQGPSGADASGQWRGRPNGHEPERALGTHDAHRRRRPEPLVGRGRCGTGRGQPRATTGEQRQWEVRPHAGVAVREVQAGRRGAAVSTRPSRAGARRAGSVCAARGGRARGREGEGRALTSGL